MKILFFINKKNGFARSLIGYMGENFPEHEFDFYIIDRRLEESLPDQTNVHRILSYREFMANRTLRNHIQTSDKIIVSGVFTMHVVLSFFPRKVLRKTYLQFWGGDFYCFRNRSKKNDILKLFMNHCVKNCAGVITLVDSEVEEFRKFFPYEKKFFSVPVPNGPKADQLMKKYREISKASSDNTRKRIVVGNSSTRENMHLEAFQMIQHICQEGVEIFCPLSYGDPQYRDEVIAKGKELFGNSFHPITEYMTYEDYMDFLLSCSVGVYNLNRQQGMGNISMLVNMGKKVYIRRDISLWSYYESYGYKMNDIADIPKQNMDAFFSWTEEDRNRNYQALDFRNAQMKNKWQDILNDRGECAV